MGSHVVTIAMTTGARAEHVGRLVAQHLGFPFISDEIIDRAARQVGVSRHEVAEVERSPSLVKRILTALGAGAVGGIGEYAASPLMPDEVDVSSSYRRLIQEVIRQTAATGKVVILAHGASMLLAGTPGVLRVFVTASFATRTGRLVAETGLNERQAEREIDRTDGERRSFFKRFYNLDEELPTHYDLVVNSDVLSPQVAARVIAYTAQNG